VSKQSRHQQQEESMQIQEQLNRLTGIVDALASSVVAHDDQIDKLIQLADKHNAAFEKHEKEMADIRRSHAETERLFQAYLKRLPPQ
jgi:hypothetical protein